LKVLYIGGTGEISFDCIHESVRAGHETCVFNRGNANDGLPDAVRFIKGDINDAEGYGRLADEGFDVICQFRAYKPEDVARDIELFGGRVGQYVFISSASAYQKPPRSHIITEDVPLENPYWEYSRLKAEAETVLTGQDSLRHTIVRPSHTFRTQPPYAVGDAATVLRRMLAGQPVIVPGDGTSLWTITRSVDFAPPFTRLLGNKQAISQTFHLTNDVPTTWNLIYEAIGRALGVIPHVVHVATETLVQYQSEWEGPLLGDKSNSKMFDNSKIKSVVGEFFCETDLDAMLANSIKASQAALTMGGRMPSVLSRATSEAAPTGDLNILFDRIARDQETVRTN